MRFKSHGFIYQMRLLALRTESREECMICFPNSDHVMFSREFAFCLFINHAYIPTYISLQEEPEARWPSALNYVSGIKSGFRSCWGHCLVFLGKTLCSHNCLLSFNRHFMNQARRTRHFAAPVMQANSTMPHST